MPIVETEQCNLQLEAPSGKGSTDENFPVGSFLIASNLRPHVVNYYAFARAGDDIADDPRLDAEEKVARLDAFEAVLVKPTNAIKGAQKAIALNESLTVCDVPIERGRKLLDAFRQDAIKTRYKTWDELINYCTMSADPVGRFLLDLHAEDRSGFEYSDALCTVLQILNHLQDCGKDKAEIDRVYIPEDWLKEEGLDVSVLDGDASSDAFRRVLDRCLLHCEPLLAQCRLLPNRLKSRRLASESTVIIRLAHKLHKRLQSQDPLAMRVKLTKLDFFQAALYGLVRFVFHQTPSPKKP